jgi:hypothetical protein
MALFTPQQNPAVFATMTFRRAPEILTGLVGYSRIAPQTMASTYA